MKKTQARIARALRGLALLVLGGGYLAGCSHHGGGSLRALAAADGKLTDGALTTSKKVSTARNEPGKITLYKNNEPQSDNPSSVAAALKIINDKKDSNFWTIELEPGTYTETEQLTYNGSATIKITGKSKTPYGLDVLIKGVGNTKVDYQNEDHRSMFEIYGTGDTILEYVMMEHTDMMGSYPYTGTDGKEHNSTQREVIGHQSKGTLAAYNCSFISRQDTIRTESKAWFYKCYIEGDVDFLWIEQSTKESKVALYEECILRAMSDRKNTVYFTAPRLPVKNEVWKGLVIWNSRLEAEENLKKVYLGRNPWNEQKDKEDGTSYFKTFYENVAIVNTKLYGKALEEAIWESGANGTDDQRFVGFKTDSHFRKPSSGLGAIIGPDIVSAEYAGRNNILNRYYDIAAGVFKEDATAYWDVAAVIEENGWEVASDTSSSLGAGETKVNSKKYDMMVLAAPGSATLAEGSADGISWKDLQDNGNKDWKYAKEGATVTFSVDEASVVELEAHNNGVGNLSATVDGTKVVDSTSACSKTAFLTSGAGEVIITFTGETYFRTITVFMRTDEKNKADAVKVNLSDTQIAISESTSATATVTPYYLNNTGDDAIPNDVTWTSSRPTVATVDASSGAVSGKAAGKADIIATSKATPSATGKAELTVTEAPTTVVPLVTWDMGGTDSLSFYSDSSCSSPLAGTTLQSANGYVVGTSNKVPLYVDATAGKFNYQSGNYVQLNSGTKVYVPVSSNSEVTVSMHGYGSTWSQVEVDGVTMTEQTYTYTANKDGYMVLSITANNTYMIGITVTNVDYSFTRNP